jgi:hypothetical protein
VRSIADCSVHVNGSLIAEVAMKSSPTCAAYNLIRVETEVHLSREQCHQGAAVELAAICLSKYDAQNWEASGRQPSYGCGLT